MDSSPNMEGKVLKLSFLLKTLKLVHAKLDLFKIAKFSTAINSRPKVRQLKAKAITRGQTEGVHCGQAEANQECTDNTHQ